MLYYIGNDDLKESGHVVVRQACGTKNANIGLLTIATDGKITAELLPWSASVPAPKLLGFSNPAAEAVEEVRAELDRSMDAVIATSAADLVIYDPVAVREDGRPVRIIQNTETNLGDLIADAYLSHYQDADIALVNASGIRANIAKGGVSLNDILKTLPYGTKLDLVEVTGQQILDALEWSVHAIPAEFGGFEHPAGLSFELNPNIPSHLPDCMVPTDVGDLLENLSLSIIRKTDLLKGIGIAAITEKMH